MTLKVAEAPDEARDQRIAGKNCERLSRNRLTSATFSPPALTRKVVADFQKCCRVASKPRGNDSRKDLRCQNRGMTLPLGSARWMPDTARAASGLDLELPSPRTSARRCLLARQLQPSAHQA